MSLVTGMDTHGGRRRRFVNRALAGAGSLALVAVLAGPVSPVVAGDEEARLNSLLSCDPSACYVAWRVVDSDDDGYADADERAAGTDPFDAASHPGLPQLADLTLGRALPSAEYGLGVWILLPDEVVEINIKQAGGLEKLTEDLAFPIPSRGDRLEKIGIDVGRLSDLGLSTEQGLTLGFGPSSSSGGPTFEARVGGIAKSWISAGTGIVVEKSTDPWGGVTGTKTTRTQTDAKTGETTVTTTYQDALGNTTLLVEKRNKTTTTTTTNPDGSTTTTTTNTSSTTTNPNPQPTSGSTPQPTSGSTPQPSGGSTPQPSGGSTSQPQPSASAGTEPKGDEEEEETRTTGEETTVPITAEDFARVLMLEGQNVRTVEPGTVPAVDWDGDPVKEPAVLIVVDPDYMAPVVLIDPAKATAKLDWDRTPVRDDITFHPQYTGGIPRAECENGYCS